MKDMMQIIGCDLTREGGRMIGTTVLAFLAGLITSLADGDAFSLSLGTGLLILTVILLAVRILRLYQKSLFTEEAHFLMTLPMPAKDLLRGQARRRHHVDVHGRNCLLQPAALCPSGQRSQPL